MSAKPLLFCNSEDLSAGKVIRGLECVSLNPEQTVLGSSNIENSLKPWCYFLFLLQSIRWQGRGQAKQWEHFKTSPLIKEQEINGPSPAAQLLR